MNIAGANASTASKEQTKQEHAAEIQARPARQPDRGTRPRTPTPPPHRAQPKGPTAPVEHRATKA